MRTNALDKAVRAQGGFVVKPHQVKAMILAARRAYDIQAKAGLVDDGVGFDAWRRATLHDVVGGAAPSSFRAVTQRAYRAVMRYFLALAGGGLGVWNRFDQPTTLMAVMWGFMPSYQYRKPSTSTVSPTFSAPTVV